MRHRIDDVSLGSGDPKAKGKRRTSDIILASGNAEDSGNGTPPISPRSPSINRLMSEKERRRTFIISSSHLGSEEQGLSVRLKTFFYCHMMLGILILFDLFILIIIAFLRHHFAFKNCNLLKV